MPELDGARCVHTAIETASCRACVEVCPRKAWRLDDAALELDSGLCDGCALCVPVCPRQAIVLPLSLARRPVAGTNALMAVCERARGDGVSHNESGYIPCIHAIGLVDLLRAYHAGEHVWLLSQGNCAGCSRGLAELLSTRVSHLNTALRQRGRPIIVLREVSLSSWTTLINTQVTAEKSARRGFFRALSQQPAALFLAVPPLLENEPILKKEQIRPSGEYLPDGDTALMPWVIHLNSNHCVGCHACVRVCPDAAIQFDEEVPAYRLRHRACTGCGLCQDICEHHAVTLQSWVEPTQWVLPLVEQHCSCCGVAFHTPAEVSIPTRFCWICANVKQKRLYQVMA